MSPRRPVRFPELGAALARARADSGLSGPQLAERLGWPAQSKVSLLENGQQRPSVDDVRAWAEATGADPDALLAERERALVRHLDIREAARRPGGVEALQDDLARLEVAAKSVAEYQPTLVPGLAQTADYTRAWLSSPGRVELGGTVDVETIVERRRQRQVDVAARGVPVTIIVTPGALTAVYGTLRVQRAQLDALVARTAAGEIELLVPRRPIAMLHGFELLGDDMVTVETVAGVRIMSDREVVATFTAVVERARSEDRSGAAARRALRQARDAL